MSRMGEEFQNPIVEYADDRIDPDNYVRVSVDIKGLEKALLSKTATNAEITFIIPTARSICLTVLPKGESKVGKYRFEVKKLPADILTDETKTYYQVEKNEEIALMLHKAKPGSWARYLNSVGLEHDGQPT